jgi:histidinol dehydrogenase
VKDPFKGATRSSDRIAEVASLSVQELRAARVLKGVQPKVKRAVEERLDRIYDHHCRTVARRLSRTQGRKKS